MSNYTIEISGNQPYYVQVDNSSLQSPINLDIIKNNDINVEVSTSNTFLAFNAPSGYPVDNLLNVETIVRTSGDQSISGIKAFNNDVVLSGNLITKSQPAAITPSHFPAFISDPSTFSRIVYTRTPSQVKSDIGLNNVQNIALSGINFSAGSGLVGGGNLSSSTSFDIGRGDGISVSSDSISVDTTVVRTANIDQSISGIKSFISNSGTKFTTGGSLSKDIILKPVNGLISSNTITVSPITTLINNRTYYLPEAGADADFVMTAGGQVITGQKTFTSPAIFNSGTFTSLRVGTTGVALIGHTHTVSNITDFSSGVNALLTSSYALINHTHSSFPSLNLGSSNLDTYLNIDVPSSYETGQYQDANVFQIYNGDLAATVFAIDGLGKIKYGTIDYNHVDGLNDAILSQIPTSIVYTSGNQSISGVKTFNNNINVSGLITANSGNFINSLNVNGTGVSISGHTHTISNITGLQTALDAKQGSGNYALSSHTHTSSNITDFNTSVDSRITNANLQPSGNYSVVGHSHTISNVTGLQTALDNKQASGNYSLTGHTHNISDITSLQTTLDNKQPSGNYALSSHTHTSSNITDFNSSVSGLLPVKNVTGTGYVNISSTTGNYTVSVTGLQPSGSYASSSHTHSSSDITNFNASVSGLVSGIYAPLNSPSLTGTPLTPTAASGTNNTQIASTAFVRTEISNLVASAPSALDTLNELAAALGNDANFSTTITNNLAGKANLSGATFTGSVSGPSGNFTSLKVNSVDVSANGHTHTSANITDFNSSVSGLLTPYQLTLTNPVTGTGTTSYVPKWISTSSVGNSLIFDNGTSVGINTNTPSSATRLEVNGAIQQTWSSSRLGMFFDNTYRMGINYNASSRIMQLFSTSSDSNGHIAFSTRIGTGSSDTDYGTERMRITNSGYVGIGTTTPTAQLQVSGTGLFTSIDINNSAIAGSAALTVNGNIITQNNIIRGGTFSIYGDNNTRIYKVDGSTLGYTVSSSGYKHSFGYENLGTHIPWMVIGSSGVGIGTITPSGALHVVGDTYIDNSSKCYLVASGYSKTMNYIWSATNGNLQVNGGGPHLILSSQGGYAELGGTASTYINIGHSYNAGGTNQHIKFTPASIEAMRITSSGNVGVGTTTPSKKLDVIGDARVSGVLNLVNTSDSTDRSIAVTSNNMTFTGVHGIFEYSIGLRGSRGSACGLESNATNGYLALAAGGSEKVRIATDGKVGIGTTTPSSQLHVIGSGLFSGDVTANGSFIGGSGTAGNPSFEFTGDPDTGLFSPAANTFGISTSGVERLRVNNIGNIGINYSAPTTTLQVNGSFSCGSNVDPTSGGQGLYLDPSLPILIFNDSSGPNATVTIDNDGLVLHNFAGDSFFYTDRTNSRIGIGTSSPTETLQVAGNIVCDNIIPSDPNNVLFRVGSTSAYIDLNIDNIGIGTDGDIGMVCGGNINLTPDSASAIYLNGNVNIDGNLTFDSYTESVVANGNSGTSKTLSLASGTVHTCTLTGNCIFTMPTATAGKSFSMFLNTGSGNYTASFSGVRWSDSTPPTITSTASKVDLLSFISDGSFWYGSFSQNYG